MSGRNQLGALLGGFILGNLIGAVLTLIFTPQSGEEMRANIQNKYIELQGRNKYRDYDREESAPMGPEPSGSGGGRPG